uniref:Uncharacterized protein n=1 Tax=Daphnia magna TaxID=35525 RepID=A0A0N8E411_9CRUS
MYPLLHAPLLTAKIVSASCPTVPRHYNVTQVFGCFRMNGTCQSLLCCVKWLNWTLTLSADEIT